MSTAPETGSPGGSPLLTARAVSVSFELGRSVADRVQHRRHVLRAVDGVDLDLYRGEALAVVGESGSGKSTFAKAVTGLLPLTGGELTYEDRPLRATRRRADYRHIQMVFQDPYSSLNPRLTVGQTLRELLRVHGVVPGNQVHEEARSLLHRVGLGDDALDAYPRQFSGGQRQRVAIARALALRPDVLVADEPVSALDVSVQATILNLLDQLRAEMGLTLLFIAHNLAVVHHLCDTIAVMYLGRIVEIGPTDEVFDHPQHPYTRGLLEAIPRLSGRRMGAAAAVEGDPPSPLAMPSGCRFHTRCPVAVPRCSEVDPPMVGGSLSPTIETGMVGGSLSSTIETGMVGGSLSPTIETGMVGGTGMVGPATTAVPVDAPRVGRASLSAAHHPHAAACLFAFDQAAAPVPAGQEVS